MAGNRKPAHGRQRLNGEGTISGPRKDGRYVGAFYALTTRGDSQAGVRLRAHPRGGARSPRPGAVQGRSRHPGARTVVEARALPRLLAGARRQADQAASDLRAVRDDHPAVPHARARQIPAQAPVGRQSCRHSSIASSGQAGQSATSRSCARSSAPRSPAPSGRSWLPATSPAWSSCPPGNRGIVVPWSSAEALTFLSAASDDPLYPAFVLLLLYGMRRGEVLGLRWADIDIDGQMIHVRQQIQRVQGQLQIGPVKTRAGNRDLPLIGLARLALTARQAQQGPTARTSAPPGLTPVSSSRPGRADLSSRATSCAPSSASAIRTAYARSACTRSATPLPHCSRIFACQLAILRSSSGTRTSRPLSRSTPTSTKQPASTP